MNLIDSLCFIFELFNIGNMNNFWRCVDYSELNIMIILLIGMNLVFYFLYIYLLIYVKYFEDYV